MANDFLDRSKTILTGRIYPAIQSCVANRYRILVGYFTVVGILLAWEKAKLKELVSSGAACLLTIVFTLFVIHNCINYCLNALEQRQLEQAKEKDHCRIQYVGVEIVSSLIMLVVIWAGYWFLRSHANSA